MSKITDSGQSPGKSNVPAPDEIWKILREVSLSQKEAGRQAREFDRRMQASQEAADRRAREFDLQLRANKEEASRRRQEFDRRMQASQEAADRRAREFDLQLRANKEEASRRRQEFDRRMQASQEKFDRRMQASQEKFDRRMQASRKEADRQIRETWRQINKMDGKYGNLWGDLVEALIQGNLIEALKEEDLDVKKIIPNYTGHLNGRIKEYDLIALNGREAVVVEAKSTLSEKKADEFLKAMAQFKDYCPEFSHLTVYAGIAGLRASEDVVKYAAKKGLFVILVKGKNAVLLKPPKGSKPRVF